MARPILLGLALALALPAASCAGHPDAPVRRTPADPDTVARFARLALSCVDREYPNKIAHVLAADQDARPPRQLTPIFFGCFDWHSSVHGHWLLARHARLFPAHPGAAEAREVLARRVTTEGVAAELSYLARPDRDGFERPYGLAWLLQLCAELRAWDDPLGRELAGRLAPLETLAAERLASFVETLPRAIRAGEHSQSAFAMGLLLDWARGSGRADVASLVERRSRELHGEDRDCALHLEPSGHDFLSPCLGAADLMRRVLGPRELARWLDRALPAGELATLSPVTSPDPSDGKLAHLDGLDLSRAWMLEGLAAGLPPDDPRVARLRALADAHAVVGLRAVSAEHYAGAHWLGTFATYLVTARGLRPG